MSAALIVPPGAWPQQFERERVRRHPIVIDERYARGVADAYMEGIASATERVMDGLFGPGYSDDGWRAAVALSRRYLPTYAALRDYLIADHNVHPVIACRVALSRTRRHEVTE
jgi:hypothetical protein